MAGIIIWQLTALWLGLVAGSLYKL